MKACSTFCTLRSFWQNEILKVLIIVTTVIKSHTVVSGKMDATELAVY